jgi:hypothetical protein
MAYIHEVHFDIDPDQIEQLQIGASLDRVLGYLRVLLPSQTGYITSRAMYSLDREGLIRIVFQSVWEAWEDLTAHRDSALSEDKILQEFEPHVDVKGLTVQLYEEVD